MPKCSFIEAAKHDLESIIVHTLEYCGIGQADHNYFYDFLSTSPELDNRVFS